ncbi:MAG: transcriptional repressor LexA [Candidatus Dojkabacteria bacterium]|nr:transcriptional repressor LexA [Candidatus Dojkabacteria bacterium]MDQ7021742.1 transcriptional repressor LexA [Candidatus Dojkabacteria bacterium]
MEKSLTKIQENVFKFISSYINKYGNSPTYVEIGTHLGYEKPENNVNAVRKHLLALEKKGYIDKEKGTGKIKIFNKDTTEVFIKVPILGNTSAGVATQIATEDRGAGVLQLDRRIFDKFPDNKRLIALKIEGNSMNNHEIKGTRLEDGNFVIVELTDNITEGDVVLAIIDDAATIKVISKSKNKIILMPDSTDMNFFPIYLDQFADFIIQGKVIAALENPSLRDILKRR